MVKVSFSNAVDMVKYIDTAFIAALAMAQGRLDEASKLYEIILRDEPTNLYALTGRVSSFD